MRGSGFSGLVNQLRRLAASIVSGRVPMGLFDMLHLIWRRKKGNQTKVFLFIMLKLSQVAVMLPWESDIERLRFGAEKFSERSGCGLPLPFVRMLQFGNGPCCLVAPVLSVVYLHLSNSQTRDLRWRYLWIPCCLR